MKNYIFIVLLMFMFVDCSRKQRSDELVEYGNFFSWETFIIKVTCPFLTDDQFNHAILDTTNMYKFDRNTSLYLLKAIQRLDYKYQWDDPDLEMYHKMQIEDSAVSFLCMGRLNLQPNVNSLIIIKSFKSPIDEEFGNPLWLFNIKDNKICSLIKLIYFARINEPFCPSICIKNKLFKATKMEEDYWFYNNLGQRFPSKDKEVFSTFMISENGFCQFTKGKRVKDNHIVIN